MLPSRRAKQKCQESMNRRKTLQNINLGHDTSFEKDKPADCSICLETVLVRGKLGVCKHWFCFQCILEWSKMTNTCPLCKIRFRCITKVNLKPWSSPEKRFYIQDKDQSLNETADDEEVALALENETSTDENDPDFQEDYSVSHFDEFDYDDSFIDDSGLSQESDSFSLRVCLRRADENMRHSYSFRALSRTNGSARQSSYQPRRSQRLNSQESNPDECWNVIEDVSEDESPVVVRRRKRRVPLNCPRSRRSRPPNRPAATVTGWINMAEKNSQTQQASASSSTSRFPRRKIRRIYSSNEDSDDSTDWKPDENATKFECITEKAVTRTNPRRCNNHPFATASRTREMSSDSETLDEGAAEFRRNDKRKVTNSTEMDRKIQTRPEKGLLEENDSAGGKENDGIDVGSFDYSSDETIYGTCEKRRKVSVLSIDSCTDEKSSGEETFGAGNDAKIKTWSSKFMSGETSSGRHRKNAETKIWVEDDGGIEKASSSTVEHGTSETSARYRSQNDSYPDIIGKSPGILTWTRGWRQVADSINADTRKTGPSLWSQNPNISGMKEDNARLQTASEESSREESSSSMGYTSTSSTSRPVSLVYNGDSSSLGNCFVMLEPTSSETTHSSTRGHTPDPSQHADTCSNIRGKPSKIETSAVAKGCLSIAGKENQKKASFKSCLKPTGPRRPLNFVDSLTNLPSSKSKKENIKMSSLEIEPKAFSSVAKNSSSNSATRECTFSSSSEDNNSTSDEDSTYSPSCDVFPPTPQRKPRFKPIGICRTESGRTSQKRLRR